MSTGTKPEVQINPTPLGRELAIVYAPFDDALEALAEADFKVISLAQNAQLRIQQGVHSFISRNAGWVMEGAVYIPKKRGSFLTRNSPIMRNAEEATKAHREERDYFLTESEIENALADSVKLFETPIPTNRFGENEITNYAFKEFSEPYGLFLREAGINEMPIWLACPKDQPFARQIWFRSLVDGSVLYGNSRDLSEDLGRMFGIR